MDMTRVQAHSESDEEMCNDSDASWSTLSEDSTDAEDPSSSGDCDSDNSDLPTVEGMMRRAQLLEQTPDTQANLDDDLWFLARDIWDWYQRQDIDVQESSGEVALEAATRLCRRSLELRPPGHPKRAHSLHNLAKYLLELHVEHDVGVADLSMLAESVALSREALSLRSLENRHYEACLETLFEALVASYTNGNGEQKVFEDALTYGKQLMEFHPPGVDSGLRGHFLSIFGDLWWARAKFTELSQDRDMGISYYKEAVECSDDVESQCQLMIRLGFCLQMSSNYGQEHVSFTNMDRANRKRKAHAIPSILDVKLATTAKAQLNISKLDEAICWFQKASKLAGLSDTDQSVALEHLGSALDTSAIINNSLERLHQAAASYRLALELLPKEHENRSELLDSLADTSAHLYGMTNDETFLLEAIGYSQRALDLCSQEPTPKRANHLVNLALLQKEHAVEQCDGDNMRLAIKYFHDALEIHMTGSDDHAVVKRHGDLAECFLTRDLPTFDLAQGAQYLLLAIKQKILPARDTLIISTSSVHLLAWAVIGTSDEPFYRDHLVQALREMMTLLAHMVSFGQDLDTRLATLNGFDWVGESFSMIAMALGMNDLALEIIEQARGLFWTQALYLREAKLDLVPDDITTELGALLSSLDEKTLEDASADDKVEDASQSTRYLRRKQADRVDELIHDIRLLPGLQRFMLAPEHSQLLKAARDSFIVVLLPCSCEAMLIRQGGQSVERLELSDMTEEILEIWTRNIRNTTFRGRGTVDYSTEEKVSEHHERGMMRKLQSKSLNEQVQAQLWQRVVKPVITAFGLQRASGRQRPRLHWCAAGKFGFMPLHAAGTVFGTNHGMPELCSDYVVSSYTTTIATLLRAQENFTSMTLPSTQILFIGEPAAPGMTPLPGVQTELEAIKKALDDHVFSLISTSKGEITTVSEVTAGLANASIAHFACHGIQNSTSPLKSGFCLHDGLLTLAQLMRLKHKRASLAFLSACETAQGDLNQPDQSLHLCSAMLFCGFESVIGTMWGISDADGPIVTRIVYQELAKKTVVNADDIAYALDAGVAELRRMNVPFDRWAPFVHYGA